MYDWVYCVYDLIFKKNNIFSSYLMTQGPTLYCMVESSPWNFLEEELYMCACVKNWWVQYYTVRVKVAEAISAWARVTNNGGDNVKLLFESIENSYVS